MFGISLRLESIVLIGEKTENKSDGRRDQVANSAHVSNEREIDTEIYQRVNYSN